MQRILFASIFAISIAVPIHAGGDGPPKGFESLFNGKDLAGWKSTGDMKVWGAEKGVIYLRQGRRRLADDRKRIRRLRTPPRIQDAQGRQLRRRHPLPAQRRSRLRRHGNPAHRRRRLAGRAAKWQNTGAIYNVVPPKTINNKAIGEWNQIKIVAKGRQITVVNNGETLVDANLDDYVKEHGKKHPGILRIEHQGPHRLPELQQARRVSQYLFEGAVTPPKPHHKRSVGGGCPSAINTHQRCAYGGAGT